MSSGAKVNSQAVADMITALVTMQNKMMAMDCRRCRKRCTGICWRF